MVQVYGLRPKIYSETKIITCSLFFTEDYLLYRTIKSKIYSLCCSARCSGFNVLLTWRGHCFCQFADRTLTRVTWLRLCSINLEYVKLNTKCQPGRVMITYCSKYSRISHQRKSWLPGNCPLLGDFPLFCKFHTY